MFPNPQDALPLPARPNLEQYKKLAKELVKACRAGEKSSERSVAITSEAIHQWASNWIAHVMPAAQDRNTAEQSVASFAVRTMTGPDNCTLAKAQFVIARSHGFASWPKFADHLRSLANRNSDTAAFEAAAEAIVAGDLAALRRLLRKHPHLARQRSTREHRATLLHYVSANGVENFRQHTPENIVEVARELLDAGSDPAAGMDVYEGNCTAFGLIATSVHPEKVGVQQALLDLVPADISSQTRLIASCLANGRLQAAEYLAAKGAPLDLESAAGLGRLETIKRCFNNQGKLQPPATPYQLQRGFLWACQYGHNAVVEYLLDHGASLTDMAGTNEAALHMAVIGAHVSTVKLLLSRGAEIEQRNGYGGTPLEQAGYSFRHGNDSTEYFPVFEVLLQAGAVVQNGWSRWINEVPRRSLTGKKRLIELFRAYGAT